MLSIDYFIKAYNEFCFDLDLSLSPQFTDWLVNQIYAAYVSYPESEPIIIEKFTHLFSTLIQGRRITGKDFNEEINPNLVDLSCLLHDIGRFKETENNEHLIQGKNFDHAEYGSLLIKNAPINDFPLLQNNKDLLSDAVKNHAIYCYRGNNVYTKIIRDADKLDNLIHLDFQIRNASKVLPNQQLSDEVFRKFVNKVQINQKDIKSLNDFIVYLANWFYDINFESTKKILIKENILSHLTEQLSQNKVEPEKIEKILKVGALTK